ncbi:2OG-Fe(II) oxygenase [Terricaulis sp.]|uniref:2OG-Fe(II) oxygenase n=1 Tax=Terricaulis sp. TaxID=2768686 RepID=UPI003784566C
MTQLRLNPAIDVQAYARTYAANKVVQIPNLFEPEIAEALERVLLGAPWKLLCQNEFGENILLSQEQLKIMRPEARKELEDGIRERAARNLGYTYYAYPMIEALKRGDNREHPIHALTMFLNSPEFVAFARALISDPRVTKIDAHASNYQRGHYLTRHVDDGAQKERRAAYTIGFSRNWQPDWGGLLAFLDDNLDFKRAYIPRFNTLTVFDGLMPHTVTSVSSFAPNGRISVAGWFRDDPL